MKIEVDGIANDLFLSGREWVRDSKNNLYVFHSLVQDTGEVIYLDHDNRLILVDGEDVEFFCKVCHLWCPMTDISEASFRPGYGLTCKTSQDNLMWGIEQDLLQ